MEMFEMMEKRCPTAGILLYVRVTPGPTGAYPSPSSIIGGIVREPNFHPLGPHAKRGEGGKGWVVNAKKQTQPSTPTDATSSEPSRSSSADATEREMELNDFGLDVTFI